MLAAKWTPAPRAVQWLAVAVINAIPIVLGAVFVLGWSHDWAVLEQIAGRLADGSLYVLEPGYNFVWSPLAAALIALVVVPLGSQVWLAAHIVVLAFLREGRSIALVLLCLPFWVDAGLGNTVVFAFVAGLLAIRGHRSAALVYLALFVLIPRPVTLPLAAWLVCRHPSYRLPFVTMAGVVAITAVGSGYAVDWVASLIPLAQSHVPGEANVGPTRILGLGWLTVGVPLAIWLTARRRFGLAGLAITPYVFPQYLLMALWDVLGQSSRSAPAFAHDNLSRTYERLPVRRLFAGLGEKVSGWVGTPIASVGLVRSATRRQQHRDVVPMDLAPTVVFGGSVDEGGIGRQEDRIGAVGIQD